MKLLDLRLYKLFKLITCQLSAQIFVIHQIVDVNVSLSVATEDLSCLFDALKHTRATFSTLSWIITKLF